MRLIYNVTSFKHVPTGDPVTAVVDCRRCASNRMTPVIPTCDLRNLECAARPSSLKLTCCYLEARALLLTMCPSDSVTSNGSGGSRVEYRKPTTAFANSSGPFVWGGTTQKVPGSGGGGSFMTIFYHVPHSSASFSINCSTTSVPPSSRWVFCRRVRP